jgi:hypothetical protein
MRTLPGVSENKRGAQAAVLHVNVAWLLVFVCNVDRSGRARRTTGLDTSAYVTFGGETKPSRMRHMVETIKAYKSVNKHFTNMGA